MLRCTGCGSTETIEQIRARLPRALSCCPERKMVEDVECNLCGVLVAFGACCSECGKPTGE